MLTLTLTLALTLTLTSSNKIVLMDEVQNLLQPSPEIQKSKQRVLMLDKLKCMLATAKNSVLVGFTATPLVGDDEAAKPLLDVIKGRGRESLLDEGFVSYFMSTPSAVFPLVSPSKVPAELPAELLQSVELKDFATVPPTVPVDDAAPAKPVKPLKPAGNQDAYRKEVSKGADDAKLSERCSLGQYFATAGRKDGAIHVLKGKEGALLRRPFDRDGKFDDNADKVLPEGFCRCVGAARPTQLISQHSRERRSMRAGIASRVTRRSSPRFARISKTTTRSVWSSSTPATATSCCCVCCVPSSMTRCALAPDTL